MEKEQTWTTAELQEDFEVIGFMAPYVAVRRKKDNIIGSLEFSDHPRTYSSFKKDK